MPGGSEDGCERIRSRGKWTFINHETAPQVEEAVIPLSMDASGECSLYAEFNIRDAVPVLVDIHSDHLEGV
jgi:hypothetical protein